MVRKQLANFFCKSCHSLPGYCWWILWQRDHPWLTRDHRLLHPLVLTVDADKQGRTELLPCLPWPWTEPFLWFCYSFERGGDRKIPIFVLNGRLSLCCGEGIDRTTFPFTVSSPYSCQLIELFISKTASSAVTQQAPRWALMSGNHCCI